MSGLKILIVDDEPFNISLFTEMLKKDNYVIFAAKDGTEAIRMAETEVPDLILMDWNMPGMDGLEALKIIKHNIKSKDIQVIMITGIMTTSVNLKTAMEEGAIDFLRKPFDKIELRARVRSTLLYAEANSRLRKQFVEIEASHKFIRSLLEGVPNPIIYYSTDGIILDYNGLFADFTEHPGCDLSGKLIYLQFRGSMDPLHLQVDQELIRSGQEKLYESHLGFDDREFLLSKKPLCDTDGKVQGIICIITEVTELKKAHRELLEIRRKELVASSLHLIQMAELNNNLISSLSQINSFVNKKGESIINNIISSYRISSKENVWKDFEMHFNCVYELFYKQLQNKFPELTPGERKLCALLRLNLSTKDIAAITFQNPNSIDVARYRLRKKLNMGLDDNLVDFLTGIERS